jgi:RNA polymerase sigma factor (sigma-70 family)
MSAPAKVSLLGGSAWSDERLVKECLKGSQEAWSALVDKYQNLIYSIPIKYGLSRDDANDIFQQVCLHLLSALPTLREPKSLAAWLIKVTSHGCFHWSAQERRMKPVGLAPEEADFAMVQKMPDSLLREVEQEQILREALAQIAPRCQELMRLLFFETPAVPYEEVAKKLGIAKGSIGFIRMRCLERLRRLLEKRGFQ